MSLEKWRLPPLTKPLPSWLARWDKIALWALCIFAAECCVGCSGNWWKIGPISIRIALFILCFLLTLPMVLYRIRDILRHPAVWLLIAFFLWIAVCAVRGWTAGHNREFLKSDITSLLSLALLPGFMVTVRDRTRFRGMLTVIFYATAVLALITTALHFAVAFLSDRQIMDVNRWLNDYSLGGFATMKAGGQRVYLRSQIFLQCALLMGLFYLKNESKRSRRFLLWSCEILILFADVVTYTRGFWIGLLFSALLLLGMMWQYRRYWLRCLGVLCVALVAMMGLSWLVYGAPLVPLSIAERISPSLVTKNWLAPDGQGETKAEETEKPFIDASDKRDETQRQQWAEIQKHWLFGTGLGKNLDGVRDDGKTEYMYQDMWMKTGLIGLLLFCSVFFLPILLGGAAWIRCKRRQKITMDSAAGEGVLGVCCLSGVALTSYFNPFLTTPMGCVLWMMSERSVELALHSSPDNRQETEIQTEDLV